THLVDLVPWILFPEQAIDYRADVQMGSAERLAVLLKKSDFQKVTGETDFPDSLKPCVQGDTLHYGCNTHVDYRLRGIHVRMRVLWDLEAAPGAGDTHLAVFRGTRSAVEVRQGADQNYRPELYVLPSDPADRASVGAALERKVADL